jgi:YD repeat-containing protein
MDGLGRLSAVIEPDGMLTNYTYDVLNNLTGVSAQCLSGHACLPAGPTGQARTFTYSALSRPQSATIMLLCVRQWGSSRPWSRLDPFSGGYIVLSLTLLAEQSVFAARCIPTDEIRRLFYSLDIDSGFERRSIGLGLAELAVFVDYAHWHLLPALDNTAAKAAGLILYLLTVA